MVLPLLLAGLIPAAIDFFQGIFTPDEEDEFVDDRPDITDYNQYEEYEE